MTGTENASTENLLWAAVNAPFIQVNAIICRVERRPDAGRQAAALLRRGVEAIQAKGWTAALAAHAIRKLDSRGAATLQSMEHAASLAVADVRGAVLAVRLLRLLPPLPRLADSHSSATPEEDKILSKVRALLAKAESTTFPEEAEALSAKAQELITRHALEAGLLDEKNDRPGGVRIVIDDPYASQKFALLARIARANRCRSVFETGYGFGALIGHPADLRAAALLYTSLLVQGTKSMLDAGTHGAHARKRGFRSSFLQAYANRVGERLTEAAEAQVKEADEAAGGSLLPVLASRDERVEEAVKELFPGLRYIRRTVSDYDGWVAGTAAANTADLSAGAKLRAS